MSKRTLGIVIGLAVLVGFVFIIIVPFWVGTSNKEIQLRNRFEARGEDRMIAFDTMWKMISQKAQIASDHKEAFLKVCSQWADARTGSPNELMRWIKENSPVYTAQLHLELMDTVEEQMTIFKKSQHDMIIVKNEQKDLITTFPTSMVVGHRPLLKLKLITSTRTERVFQTGKDDDVDVFKDVKK